MHALKAALWPTTGTVGVVDHGFGTWAYQVGEGSDVEAVTMTDLMTRFGVDRIELLKLDVEGAEVEILTRSDEWIDRVDMIVAELHDLYVEGCTQAFDAATMRFGLRARRGENVMAARDP